METVVQPDSLDPTEVESFIQSLNAIGRPPRLVGPTGSSVELPTELLDALLMVANEAKGGDGVAVMALSAILTTAEAAELLNVSRPYVVKLIDNGELAHHMAGTHRRVKVSDLLEYRARRAKERETALTELHTIADEAGMDL